MGLYVEHPITSAMSAKDVQAHRDEFAIVVTPEEEAEKFKPITNFSCLQASLKGRCTYTTKYLDAKKFVTPSPIQSQCWAPLLAGRDVVGIASTGSGKTLGFLIPGLLRIECIKATAGSKVKGVPMPRILIVSPTRELAMQSHQVVEDMGGPLGVCIYGGVPKGHQKSALQAGAEVVVATPGRLMDLLEEKALSLDQVCYLVLDEADRMLDEGFEPTIRKICSLCKLPPTTGEFSLQSRQTVMFSATWPEEIRQLAEKYLSPNMVKVTVGSDELSANHRVTQIVECVQGFEKDKKLGGLLEKYHKSRKNRILIFVLYKREAAELQVKLSGRGYNVTAIHGDKSQQDRTNALEEFKSGRIPLLIATDVAARGLDIPQVEYVINYSFPLTVEDYVHRIGRTGRGGATGTSHTFFTDFDKGLAGALVAVLTEASQEIPAEIYQYPMVTKKRQSKLYGDFGPKADLAGKKATKITFD
ncbi:P-loop containing nucleoside triphosphate hydrolase protein [Ochromonadaceae sp. CCMP2298]|nr:P-loop containing nucleoside triphosphate hydrolase protein [Ochromonadaceae sp. CCMP2298]